MKVGRVRPHRGFLTGRPQEDGRSASRKGRGSAVADRVFVIHSDGFVSFEALYTPCFYSLLIPICQTV